MSNFNYTKLPPFKWFVLENFPFIEADFDALTNWQLFCKIGKEINTIVSSVNTLGTQVETVTDTVNTYTDQVISLSEAFTELQNYVNNYFDNLDVQDEINNKLDEMAESGELEEIIAQFLNVSTYTLFSTVADMKESEKLVNGSMCQTLGFHSKTDFGGATYLVREKTNEDVADEITKIDLHDNTLIAELLIKDTMNVKQFGAKGDNETDDTVSIQTCINNVKTVIIPNGTYLIKAEDDEHLTGDYPHGHAEYNGGLNLPSNIEIKGLKGSTLKVIPNEAENYVVFRAFNKSNITIDNVTILGDKDEHETADGEWGHGIMILQCQNVNIKNCNISKTWGDGIYLGILYGNTITSQNTNVNIINNIIDDVSRNGISMCSGKNVVINNNKCSNITRTAPKSAIDIEPEGNGTTSPILDNIEISDFISENNVYGVHYYYSTACASSVIMNLKNIYSKNDRVSFVFSTQSGITNPDTGIINCENIYSENSGYTAFSILNWKDGLADIYLNNVKIVNPNTLNNNDNLNGSGLVIIQERSEQIHNIIIDNLSVIDTRSTKLTVRAYHCAGMSDGKIILRNPKQLDAKTNVKGNFSFTELIDGNCILIDNLNYSESIIDVINLKSRYLTSGYNGNKTIRFQNTGTSFENLGNDTEIQIVNDGTHSVLIDFGTSNKPRIYPFSNSNRYLKSTDAGATMKIKKINGNWYAISYSGTWTNSAS